MTSPIVDSLATFATYSAITPYKYTDAAILGLSSGVIEFFNPQFSNDQFLNQYLIRPVLSSLLFTVGKLVLNPKDDMKAILLPIPATITGQVLTSVINQNFINKV